MAYLTPEELYENYTEAERDSKTWKQNYPEYERLMDNGLLDGLDETLPEVNDGSLAASLFKAPKRVIPTVLAGRAKALDDADEWLTELANIYWEKKILPNATAQGTPRRKWKDAVRKSMGYGGVPIYTFFGSSGSYTGSNFIVLNPHDVILEQGKRSDLDSDIIYYNVYYTKLQLRNIIEEAEAENKAAKAEGRDSYNKWDVAVLKSIVKSNMEEDYDQENVPRELDDRSVKKSGFKFCIAFQRGVDAPFYMYHPATKKTARSWENPDPTGDIPIHYLYCYQDFVNPYGIGLARLAGGTQNVLDYMRQADVLATQLGIRPPIRVGGDISQTNMSSLVYAQDALWEVGNAQISREELGNNIYSQLPNRIGMYKISLDQMLPTGNTSIGANAGDEDYSKTPAGVKARMADMSVDDEDFKENFNECYEKVAKSMINIHFANMQGTELLDLTDVERQRLAEAGMDFPLDDNGNPTGQLEVIWDNARANFDFEMDADADKTKDEEKQLEGSLRVYELVTADPMAEQQMMQSGWKLNMGELLADIIGRLTDNDKIITELAPEEQMAMQQNAMGGAMGMEQPGALPPEQAPPANPEDEQAMVNIQAVMQEYGVDDTTAAQMLEAERQGIPIEQIQEAIGRMKNA